MFDKCVARAATYCALRGSCEGQTKSESDRERERDWGRGGYEAGTVDIL